MTRNDQLNTRTARHEAEEHPAALKKRIDDLETSVHNLRELVEQMLRPKPSPMQNRTGYDEGDADEEAW